MDTLSEIYSYFPYIMDTTFFFLTLYKMNNYGNKLNPQRMLRIPRSIKGERQSICVTHNPSQIDENQLYL